MKNGFSLIELMFVLGIIGLLSILAYPSYINHLTHARRLDGQTALLELAIRLDHHQTPKTHSNGGWYDLHVEQHKDQTYQLKAIPKHAQATHDTRCQTLTLQSNGLEGITAGPQGIIPTGPVDLCW